METGQILELFDRQMRRDLPGLEELGRTKLFVSDGWSGVLWSDLDEATADAEIARAVARLRELPGYAEWKLYGHDRPDDLAQRLRAAGLEADEEEVLLAAEVDALSPAAGADVRIAGDDAGIAAFMDVQLRAFGERPDELERELREALLEETPEMLAVVAYVDGAPVSTGRVELTPGVEFAGLYGGSTVPAFRGRGLYRATVAMRAELARKRGYRFLYVDAMPTSRPILERLGFVQLSTTAPFTPARTRPGTTDA